MSNEKHFARFHWALLLMLGGLFLLIPLLAGCSAGSMAQTTTPTPTPTPQTAKTTIPALAGTPQPTVPSATQAAGTPTVRPTPAGPPPTPENVLNIFNAFPSSDVLVKRDALQLDKDDTLEILFTITGPSEVVTGENRSAIGVLDYDPKYREWNLTWNTSSTIITGTASPLPAANRIDGYNGGDLLHTGAPIFLLRTTSIDGHAHLSMWKWDSDKHQGVPLKMVPAAGGPEQDAAFEGDLDVNVADLGNDGIYEVIADNLKDVQIWKWDGSKYVPEAKR